MAGTNLPIPSSLADRIGREDARRLCREIWGVIEDGLDGLLSGDDRALPEHDDVRVLLAYVAELAAHDYATQMAAVKRSPLAAVLDPEIPDPELARKWAQKLGGLARSVGAIDSRGNPTREIVRRQGPPELVAENDVK